MELSAFLLPATLATFSVAFCIVWRFGSKPAFWWMLGYAAQCLAYLGEIVPTVFHEQIDTMIVDSIFVVGFFGFWQALCLFFGWPCRARLALGLAAVVCAIDAWQIFGAKSLKGELLAVDLGLAALILVPLLLNVRRVPKAAIDKAMVAVTVLTILNCVVVSSLFAIFGDAGAGFDGYMGSSYVAVSYAVTSILNIVVPLVQLAAVALVAIANHRNASEVDLLTGLLNRRGFNRGVMRHGIIPRGVLVIGDIDHFKRVNDGFGHAVGDQVIAAFADVARTYVPPDGLAARFGGEEFVVFLPHADVGAGEAFVRSVASEFRQRVASGFPLPFVVTASFGIAGVSGGTPTLIDDLERADRALYAAKQAGRNRMLVDQDRRASSATTPLHAGRPTLRAVV